MITDWIYGSPTWLWGTLFVSLCAVAAGIGLIIFHRLIHLELRRAHNELAGFLVAVISVTYAVLLAFIAVATWESYSHAQEIVDNEADYVGSIYRDTQGLPPEMGQGIRDDLERYVKIVVNEEWPMQREGKTPGQAWAPLRRLHGAIATMQPTTRQEVIELNCSRPTNSTAHVRTVSPRSKGTSPHSLVHHPHRRPDHRLYLSLAFTICACT